MTYLSGGSISDCSTIDFEDNDEVTVQFSIELKKPYNMAVGTGNLKIFTKKSSSYPEIERYNEIVQNISWSGSQPDEFYYSSLSITLDAVDFNTSGGKFYACYISSSGVSYCSCNYSIEKDEVPSFSLSPTATTVSCQNTSPKTFTVTPSNIPSGANVVYNWSVGSGWLRNGNPVSNFTTTTTSVTLVPYNFPPNNVNVTPILNGDSYPTLTSTVSLGNFNPVFEISGDNYVCDTSVYTFNNLPSSISIQSVSTSNPNIATATLNSNTGEVTVTKVADGIITLSAVLQNSCNQTVTKTKENIQIGIPSSVFNATITGNNFVCQGQTYTYTLNGANHPCVSGINWSVSSNLNIISQTANTITVSKYPFSTENSGQITASIPGSTVEVTKGVWVGTLSNDGLTIQKIGRYDLYAGRWTKLYAFHAPIMYESNDLSGITYEWQIPNSMIRNYADTAYKDVKPRFGGQLNIGVRAVCECGSGEWSYRLFDVGGGSTSGPNELIPAN